MEFERLKDAGKDVDEGSKDDTDEKEEQEIHQFPTNHKMTTRACSGQSKTDPQETVKPTKANTRLQKKKRKNTPQKREDPWNMAGFCLAQIQKTKMTSFPVSFVDPMPSLPT